MTFLVAKLFGVTRVAPYPWVIIKTVLRKIHGLSQFAARGIFQLICDAQFVTDFVTEPFSSRR